jgi:uncharacterized protein
MNTIALLARAALCVLVLQACGEDDPLPLVRDGADLLTEKQEVELSVFHQLLLLDHDIDYRVITTRGYENSDVTALELFDSMSAGERSSRGRGLLLVLNSDMQEVRLEVGFSLEGVFPDAFVAYLEHRQMVPFFVEDRISDGILASTELIIDRAQKASKNASWDDEIWMEGSGGAGARTTMRAAPGFRVEPRSATSPATPSFQHSPTDVVDAYLDAMRRRDSDPGLSIYTPETRQLLREWLVTPAQMDQIARTYARCSQGSLLLNSSGERAVIRYPISQRQCAPWFLANSGEGWQLDLTMQQVIRFGRSNAWRFDLSRSHPYEFAFDDWELDRNGFPIRDLQNN